MKKVTHILPKQLVDQLEASTLTEKQRSIAIQILQSLIYKSAKQENIVWFPLQGHFLNQSFGAEYSIALKFLLNNNIISRSASYLPGLYSYSYKLNKSILNNNTSFINGFYKRERRLNKPAAAKEEKQNKSLIKYANKVLKELELDYDSAIEWVMKQQVSEVKKLSYITTLTALKHKNFFCSRNTTNGRLDTNITNLKSSLLAFVKLKGEQLEQLDLSNSQLVFLNNLMGKESSELLNQLISEGALYEYIQTKLNLKSRSEAKQLTFTLLFSKHTLKSKEKQELKHILPQLVNYTDKYKKENGDNQLAIKLQQMESTLFIDKILKECKEQSLLVLTKHDSILCKKSDLPKVKEIIHKHLTTMFGVGNFKLKHTTCELKQEEKETKQQINHLNRFRDLNEEEAEFIEQSVNKFEIRLCAIRKELQEIESLLKVTSDKDAVQQIMIYKENLEVQLQRQ